MPEPQRGSRHQEDGDEGERQVEDKQGCVFRQTTLAPPPEQQDQAQGKRQEREPVQRVDQAQAVLVTVDIGERALKRLG